MDPDPRYGGISVANLYGPILASEASLPRWPLGGQGWSVPLGLSGPAWLRVFDWVGTIAFAMSGALTASGAGMDMFGVCFIATLTAIGGGTTRDFVFLNRPPFWMEEIEYLHMSLATAFFVMVFWRRIPGGLPSLWLKKDIRTPATKRSDSQCAWNNCIDTLSLGVVHVENVAEDVGTKDVDECTVLLNAAKGDMQNVAMPTATGGDMQNGAAEESTGEDPVYNKDAQDYSVKKRVQCILPREAAPPTKLRSQVFPLSKHERSERAGNRSEGPLLWWLDALGLGAFAVVGAKNGAAHGVDPFLCCICGVCTATGGGLIRDVICGLPVEKRSNGRVLHSVSNWYAFAAFCGAAVYMALLMLGALLMSESSAPLGSVSEDRGRLFGFAGVLASSHARIGAGILVTIIMRVLADKHALGLPSWTNAMKFRVEESPKVWLGPEE